MSKSPVRVIAREHSDRSNLTVFRSVKYGGIAVLPLIARNDETACINVEITGKIPAGQIKIGNWGFCAFIPIGAFALHKQTSSSADETTGVTNRLDCRTARDRQIEKAVK